MKRRNNLSWLDATKLVLSTSEDAMCQTQILQKISELGLKDTNVPSSSEMVMRALLANSAGKNPCITKVDQKFIINANYKSTNFNHDTTLINKRQLPQRKKTKTISDDFVDSDSLINEREEKVSYSPYSSHTFDHVRKNKRMRIRAAVTLPKVQVKAAILLKDSVNSAAQPKHRARAELQDMFNGNSDIMKYDVIAKKCMSMDEFTSLSKCQQRYLASLLPSSDVRKERNNVKLLPTALSNPFFVSFFREWQDKLGKGELSVEFANKVKLEAEKQVAKNPWKESFFEDVWGFSRAEQVKTTRTKQRERRDTFEDSIKESLSLVPPTFFIQPAPVIDPIQESLTPPTSDGSEHDRSHITNTDLLEPEKDLQILTPDHEMDQEKLEPLVLDHHDSVMSGELVDTQALEPQLNVSEHSDMSGLLDNSIELEPEIPRRSHSPAPDVLCPSEPVQESPARDEVHDVAPVLIPLELWESKLADQESNAQLGSTDRDSAECFEWHSEPSSITVANSESDCLDKRKSVDLADMEDDSGLVDDPDCLVDVPGRLVDDPGRLVDDSSRLVDVPDCLKDNPGRLVDDSSRLVDDSSRLVDVPDCLKDDPGRLVDDLSRLVDDPDCLVDVPVRLVDDSVRLVDDSVRLVDVPARLVDDEPRKQPNLSDIPTAESNHEMSFPELDLEDQILPSEFEQQPKDLAFPVIDDPELTCDFISDKSWNKQEDPSPSIKTIEEPTSITVTKLMVSDDISLNIMNEIKDLKVPTKPKMSDMKLDLSDVPNPLAGYNSPTTSSCSSGSSPRTDTERRERLTLKILKKDLILPPEPYPVKHKKSKKHKSRHHKSSKSLGVSNGNSDRNSDRNSDSSNTVTTFPQQHFRLDSNSQFSIVEDESEQDLNLKRISLQQQLLAEKGIKSSSIPVESTKNLVKTMREKQQCQALPKLTKAPSEQPMVVLDSGSQRMYPHKSIPVVKDFKYSKQLDPRSPHPLYNRSDSSESIRSALKAKINQRRYTDIPINLDEPPPQYTPLSSGNHCCYVVKGSPHECVCSTAPMLFCTKCYHLSHSSCSNVLCSNCGALFKFN